MLCKLMEFAGLAADAWTNSPEPGTKQTLKRSANSGSAVGRIRVENSVQGRQALLAIKDIVHRIVLGCVGETESAHIPLVFEAFLS